MSLGNTAIFGMMTERMSWLSQRQRVISQNIANADTPEYRARDIADLKFKDSMARNAMKVNLTVSDPQHVTLPEDRARFSEGKSGSVYETSISENSVVLEEQMMKLSQNAGDYTLATSLYRKYTALHNIALGRAGQG